MASASTGDSRRFASDNDGDSEDTVRLIWVDATIDAKNSSCKQTIDSLSAVCANLKLFQETEKLKTYLEHVHRGRTFIVTSGSLGKETVRIANPKDCVTAIYVFCGDPAFHKTWANACEAVKLVENRIQPICEAIKSAIGVSSGASSSHSHGAPPRLDQLDPSFLDTLALKHVILKMKYDEQAKDELVKYSQGKYADQKSELELIDEFRKDYSRQKAIWWFSRESFVYKLLNRSLRSCHVQAIMKMGFFIQDLDRQLKALYQEQVKQYAGKTLTLYRGQCMSSSELDNLRKKPGSFIGFNSFLSVSRKKEVSMVFAKQGVHQPNMIGVLLVITVDTQTTSTPFADINAHDYSAGEESLLFCTHSVFRVESVKPCEDSGRVTEIRVTSVKLDEKDLRSSIESLDSKLTEDSKWRALVEHYLERKRLEQAKDLCLAVIEQRLNNREQAECYLCYGMIQEQNGEYDGAIKAYEQALLIDEKLFKPTDPHMALMRFNIGMLYYETKNYSKSLHLFQKALEIWQRSYPPFHPQILVVNRMIQKVEKYMK